jgi:hypothetical protein
MGEPIICARHAKPPEEHTAESIIRCFEFGECPVCEGECLSDGRALCTNCGASGKVVVAASVPAAARNDDVLLVQEAARFLDWYDSDGSGAFVTDHRVGTLSGEKLRALSDRLAVPAAATGDVTAEFRDAIMHAIELTVETCAAQWFDEELPTEAWIVDYAAILSEVYSGRATESREAAATPPRQWRARLASDVRSVVAALRGTDYETLANRLEDSSREVLHASDDLLRENYWCGCERRAIWTRCEQHTHLDHDEEPPTRREQEERAAPARSPAEAPSRVESLYREITALMFEAARVANGFGSEHFAATPAYGDVEAKAWRLAASQRSGDDTLELNERLDALNEAAKQIGNELWERGEEWHELANYAYRAAKQLWIATGIALAAARPEQEEAKNG